MSIQSAGHTFVADIAVSGGGHRATAWALGAIYAAVRARNASGGAIDIASVASVSGGSIANGVVATEVDDLNDVDPETFGQRMQPLIETISTKGVIFWAEATNRYVISLLVTAGLAAASVLVGVGAVIGASRDFDPIMFFVPVLAAIAAAALFGLWHRLGGGRVTVRRVLFQVVFAAVAGALIGAGLLLGRSLSGNAAFWSVAGVFAGSGLLWWLTIVLASRRGNIVEKALEEMHFTKGGNPVLLSDLKDRPVHHVFCATELQSGDHLYLSPRLINSYQLGEAEDSHFTVAKAVQASAALPAAFPPQETDLRPWSKDGVVLERPWDVSTNAPETPVGRLVLVDGGVYDNMGEQWSIGFAARAKRSAMVSGSQRPAELLIVANSGKTLTWLDLLPTSMVARELRGLARDQSIQYDATTAQRRSALVARFRAGEVARRTGEEEPGLVGVIAHMGTSPYRICRRFENSPNEQQRDRAKQMLNVLGGEPSRQRWEKLVNANGGVGTVLNALGRQTVLDLIEHSSVLTLVALYVIHGIGLPTVPERSELEALFFT